MGKKPSFFDKLLSVKSEALADEEVIATQVKNIKASELPKTALFGQKEDKDWPPEAEGQLTIDVYQTPSEVIIKSTIAGVDPENLDITITNDMVTVRGRREKDAEIKSEDYYYQECYWGAFSRSVILPVDVDSEKSEASLKNGILTIHLPKIEKTKTKKIKVKTT